MTERELLNAALIAREAAYAPYSGYRVGAALLAEDGTVYTGCNMENASYSATICAERAAFAAAISAGVRKFKAIAVAGGKGRKADEAASPCGICRQVMAEFCKEDFAIILGNEATLSRYTLGELLPLSFALEEK
ncbi:MAG: cytidine deaminase [Clostridia bacterium]|nr:cytidine deaminase [Clostridia bacterium]